MTKKLQDEVTITPVPEKDLIPFKVIANTKKSTLIEWASEGVTKRGYVPSSYADTSGLPQDVLDAALPYGVPWEEVLKLNLTPASLAKELNNAGVFTYEDTLQPDKVFGALQKALGADLTAIREAAYNFSLKGAK